MTYERNRILLPAMLFRAGTSKGIYLLERDMPADRAAWDALLLHLMGSPSKTQIDGLGGAQSVTSKVAIVQPSARPDADVDYTFAQVSVDQSLVSYKGNCGNILSGVGPFAIERGLVQPQEGITAVHIYNTNTDKYITADVPVKNGQVVYDGDYAIAGVPGTAAPIRPPPVRWGGACCPPAALQTCCIFRALAASPCPSWMPPIRWSLSGQRSWD